MFIVTETSLKIYMARLDTKILKDSVASHYRTAASPILKSLKLCFFFFFMVMFSPAPALSPDCTHSLLFHRMEVLLF